MFHVLTASCQRCNMTWLDAGFHPWRWAGSGALSLSIWPSRYGCWRAQLCFYHMKTMPQWKIFIAMTFVLFIAGLASKVSKDIASIEIEIKSSLMTFGSENVVSSWRRAWSGKWSPFGREKGDLLICDDALLSTNTRGFCPWIHNLASMIKGKETHCHSILQPGHLQDTRTQGGLMRVQRWGESGDHALQEAWRTQTQRRFEELHVAR